MRKLKLFKQITFILFVSILILFLFDNILVALALVFEKDVLHFGHFDNDSPSLFVKTVIVTKSITFSFFMYGASFLIRILLLKNIKDYFNNNTSLFLFKAGKFIALANFVSFFLSFAVFFIDVKYVVYFGGDSKYLSLLMIVFGLFLMIFSKVLIEGNQIKQENDLTI
ncbi:DUF2975 domain-containing protein [Tenacibaculum retecalamus]|uniref:DUF2975 domain-containing protein n=1 Tax=Tenacibaculum retecalamus TaxID=3018315 RepID=UPI0023D96526|nr:DUF2975 domain-containing protein [Tenacibaculum retecalamus]WBX71532.1 hypothetical protein PG912_01705 [Tenacibaculum retecalamus]